MATVHGGLEADDGHGAVALAVTTATAVASPHGVAAILNLVIQGKAAKTARCGGDGFGCVWGFRRRRGGGLKALGETISQQGVGEQ